MTTTVSPASTRPRLNAVTATAIGSAIAATRSGTLSGT